MAIIQYNEWSSAEKYHFLRFGNFRSFTFRTFHFCSVHLEKILLLFSFSSAKLYYSCPSDSLGANCHYGYATVGACAVAKMTAMHACHASNALYWLADNDRPLLIRCLLVDWNNTAPKSIVAELHYPVAVSPRSASGDHDSPDSPADVDIGGRSTPQKPFSPRDGFWCKCGCFTLTISVHTGGLDMPFDWQTEYPEGRKENS